MKKMMTLALIMTIAISANAMNYATARNEALFLSDKMAYALNLTDAQYEAVYEINLDYLMSVNVESDLYGPWWHRRNADLKFVLTPRQYNTYAAMSYFYRPLGWDGRNWAFHVYSHYPDRGRFYKAHPSGFKHYRGGNNRKPNHYAGRHPEPRPHGGAPTWRNPGRGGHHAPDPRVAHNAHGSFGHRR